MLTEGKVSMEVHWGLDEEEIKKGYILCCQSYPLTEKLSVDFDIK
jgi:ring-1,2-phenylacetyl-CoA epoxidase subunit PaaE